MTRITKKDIRDAAQRLTQNARMAGLLDWEETIVYNAGNASNGIAAVLSVCTVVEHQQRSERQSYWLPRFSYNETLRTQYMAVESATDVLRAVFDMMEKRRAEALDQMHEISDKLDN